MFLFIRDFIASRKRKSKIKYLNEIKGLKQLSKSIRKYLCTASEVNLDANKNRLLEENIFAHLFAKSQTSLFYEDLSITVEGRKLIIVVCLLTGISVLFDQIPFQIYEKIALPAKTWILGQDEALIYWLYFVCFSMPIALFFVFLYWAQFSNKSIVRFEYSRRRWMSDDNPVKIKLEKKVYLNDLIENERYLRNIIGLILVSGIWFFLIGVLFGMSLDDVVFLYSILKLSLISALCISFWSFQRNRYLNKVLPTFIVFTPYLTSISICRRKYLDFQSLELLIRNLDAIADWFFGSPLRFRGLGKSSEIAVFDVESRKLAKKIHAYKWWVVHPKRDTYAYLSRQMAWGFINLMINDWDSLLRLAEKDSIQEEISTKELIAFNVRKYLRIIFNALTPVILLFAFQFTPFRLEGESLEYIAMGVFAFSAIVLLLELNPRYLEYFSGFSEVVKVFRDRKS